VSGRESSSPRTLPAGAFEADLDALEPDSGRLEQMHARARIGERLFGATLHPVKLDRFVLLDRIGQGSMGVVYGAYDPQLDRRVAVKLLVPELLGASRVARDRLLREARGLARLSHPNVVAIHDVGVIDDQVYVVMEFVIGQNLRAWLQAGNRSWREILAVYAQAGRGLAAAHAAGLIHRDFKPENALVGEDGRVRVLDFGLVRGRYEGPTSSEETPADEPGHAPGSAAPGNRTVGRDSTIELGIELGIEPGEPGEPGGPGAGPPVQARAGHPHADLDQPLTATGTLMGTPAYMSPEQHLCDRVGPASDQFSFCVALYEAFYGQRPFAGDTFGELRENLLAGRIREPPRSTRVPGWVLPVLRRGLSLEPEQRHPSMPALLAALDRDPARGRRWVTAATALAALALAGTAFYALARPPAIAPCSGAEREIADLWSPARRAAVRATLLDTGHAYAGEAWSHIDQALQTYVRAWADMHTDACQAHQRGHQSGEMLDRRMLCLDDRKAHLAEAVTVLGETAQSPASGVTVVRELPPIAHCANLEALAAQVPPPEDPRVARRVAALRERMRRSAVLEHAGRYAEGRALIEEVLDEAESLGYRPLLAEALLAHGRLVMNTDVRAAAIQSLHRAAAIGLTLGMDAIVVEAFAQRIYAQWTDDDASAAQNGEQLELLLSVAESIAERNPDSAFGHALLLSNTGSAYIALAQPELARTYLERALAVRERVAEPRPFELAKIPRRLALVTPEPERRAALMQQALDEVERSLGAAHPETLVYRTTYSRLVPDPRRAREILEPACRDYERYHRDAPLLLAGCLHHLSFLDTELGEHARAAGRLMHLVALLGPRPHHESLNIQHQYDAYRELARGYALLYRGQPRDAIVALQASIDALSDRSEYWWIEKRIAIARLGIGMSELALAEHEAARRALEPALASFTRLVTLNQNIDSQSLLALTQVALATALWNGARGGGDDAPARQERARALVAAAEAWYRSAGPGYEARLRALASWPHIAIP
jgi:serine/threonine protein kinase/tetratricopeptide (TPR) repeat protein